MYKTQQNLYSQVMRSYSVSQARAKLAEVVDLANREPVILEKHGAVAAVVISPERYEAMMNALEEAEDQQAFDSAMAEEGENVSWDEALADLGWT